MVQDTDRHHCVMLNGRTSPGPGDPSPLGPARQFAQISRGRVGRAETVQVHIAQQVPVGLMDKGETERFPRNGRDVVGTAVSDGRPYEPQRLDEIGVAGDTPRVVARERDIAASPEQEQPPQFAVSRSSRSPVLRDQIGNSVRIPIRHCGQARSRPLVEVGFAAVAKIHEQQGYPHSPHRCRPPTSRHGIVSPQIPDYRALFSLSSGTRAPAKPPPHPPLHAVESTFSFVSKPSVTPVGFLVEAHRRAAPRGLRRGQSRLGAPHERPERAPASPSAPSGRGEPAADVATENRTDAGYARPFT